MPFDSLIFDLDGTLWDTAEVCARAWDEEVKRHGVAFREITREDMAGLMGLTAEQCRAKMFPTLPVEIGTRLQQACFLAEVQALRSFPHELLYPGVREGLIQLSRRYPLFIVSNCDEPYLEAFLSGTGLRALFRDSECHGRTKFSKGQNIAAVVHRNELRAPAYIGDTASDETAAREAGVGFIHVEYGFGRCDHALMKFRDFEALALELAAGHA